MRGSQKNKDYKIKWNNNFAYAVGLFTADGCLSSDGRHLDFTSKDKEQVINFKNCLNLTNKITKKTRAKEKIKKYYHVQFSNVKLYKFLEGIGLMPRKSLVLKEIKTPTRFFPDFLRGLFDGDGSFHTFIHPESQYPQFRVKFASASPNFIRWLHKEINKRLDVRGYITKTQRAEVLEYAKSDSVKILNFMYYFPDIIYLTRKFQKARPYFKNV